MKADDKHERASALMKRLSTARAEGETETPEAIIRWSSTSIRCQWEDDVGRISSGTVTASTALPVQVSRWRQLGHRGVLARLLRLDRDRHWLCATLRTRDGLELPLRARLKDPACLDGLPFHRVDGMLVPEETALGVLAAALVALDAPLARWDRDALEDPIGEAKPKYVMLFEGRGRIVMEIDRALTLKGLEHEIKIGTEDTQLRSIWVLQEDAKAVQEVVDELRAEGILWDV